MSESNTTAVAPDGELEALHRRIRDLEAQLFSLREYGQAPLRNASLSDGEFPSQQWQVLANAMPQFVWVAPVFGKAEFINRAWFDYTGLPPKGLDLSSWSPVIHPDDIPGIAAMWERALASGAESNFEYRVKRASDGMWRWHLGFHRPVRDNSGAIVNWIGVAFDIHDRKLAEDALRSTEERQRLAVDAGAIGLWDWEIGSNRVVWSDRVYEFHGLDTDSFGGTPEEFVRLIHPDDVVRVNEAIRSALDHDTPYDLEFRLLRSDGTERWLSTRARVIRDPQGRALRMLGATVDITAERRAQQELKAAELAMQSLIEYAPDGLFVADQSGRYTQINPAACALLGYTREELLNKSIADLVRPEEQDRLAQLRANVLAGKIEVSEWELKSKDGEWIPVEVSTRLLPDGRWQAFVRDVRERRRLESSALHLAAIVESSDDAIISKDLNGIITSWNRSAERVFGYTAEEVIGRPVSILIPPNRMAEEPDILSRLQRGERVDHFETIRRRKDGELLNISLTISPIRNAAGRIIGASKIARDITRHKRAEEALEESQRQLRFVLDNAPAFIAYIDTDYRYVRINKAYEDWFGLPAEKIRGLQIRDAFGEEYFKIASKKLELVRAGERVAFDAVVRRPNGEERYLAVIYTPDIDAQGAVKGFIALLQDVTERKQSELREKQARQTAELLNRVGPTLVAELDLERLVQSVTDIATELVSAEFGSFFHNIVNEKDESYVLYALSGVSRETFAKFQLPGNTNLFAATFRAHGVVLSPDITQDPRYAGNAPDSGMPGGHLPFRSYLAVPVSSRSGEILGGLFFGHSAPNRFTEQHAALISGLAAQSAIALDNARLFEQAQWVQDELQRSNRDLRRANQDLETFAYSASHDLQEPLRMIAISAQLLERKAGDLSDENKAFLKGILEGAGRMQTLIQDLLSYTRATRQGEGPIPLLKTGDVLDAVLKDLKPSLDESKAQVVCTELPPIAVHEVHLTQLFHNLIGNALKYRSTKDPYVHISAVVREGWNVFSVSDNGIGIDPRFGDQIFGLFKRLHTREEYPGSGIGLAICKRIVEQYGGRIWLERSDPGSGSVFCFALPTQPVR